MLILLTGGSACGKSSYGEKLAVLGPKPLYYIAAMQPYDDECLKKIARHRELRKDKGFLTIERECGATPEADIRKAVNTLSAIMGK